MKKCPFCAEEIKDEAVKCRYCGSAIKGGKASMDAVDFGSTSRDVAQGLKKKELDDMVYHIWIFIAIVAGIFFGYAFSNWVVGFGVFFVIGMLAAKKYFKK